MGIEHGPLPSRPRESNGCHFFNRWVPWSVEGRRGKKRAVCVESQVCLYTGDDLYSTPRDKVLLGHVQCAQSHIEAPAFGNETDLAPKNLMQADGSTNRPASMEGRASAALPIRSASLVDCACYG